MRPSPVPEYNPTCGASQPVRFGLVCRIEAVRRIRNARPEKFGFAVGFPCRVGAAANLAFCMVLPHKAAELRAGLPWGRVHDRFCRGAADDGGWPGPHL